MDTLQFGDGEGKVKGSLLKLEGIDEALLVMQVEEYMALL